MKYSYRLGSLLLFCIFSVVAARAACHVVDDSAAGGGNGNDWTTAWQVLPATLVRGDTYYLSDGTYPKYVANTAVSGVTLITIKKAIASDHCTDTGWNLGTMGSGQATFSSTSAALGPLIVTTPYWVFDGQKRDSKTSGHGFVLTWNSPLT